MQTLTVQVQSPEARKILRNREFILDRGATQTVRTLADDDELLEVLAREFGLHFAPGTRFR